MFCALSAIVSLLPHPQAHLLVDQVDCIELNHRHDHHGDLLFHQLIFWDIQKGDYHVRDWRMGNTLPYREGRTFHLLFYDRKLHVYRHIQAPAFSETSTRYDPELQDRHCIPLEHRRLLTKPPD